jgi:hypothetical protein
MYLSGAPLRAFLELLREPQKLFFELVFGVVCPAVRPAMRSNYCFFFWFLFLLCAFGVSRLLVF